MLKSGLIIVSVIITPFFMYLVTYKQYSVCMEYHIWILYIGSTYSLHFYFILLSVSPPEPEKPSKHKLKFLTFITVAVLWHPQFNIVNQQVETTGCFQRVLHLSLYQNFDLLFYICTHLSTVVKPLTVTMLHFLQLAK